ncbi:MAG: hypothetical protein JRH19_06285 [Deltaproteobacteria bacterium]|nr:hypothetical protein [Deltaproteobacteria bacterium]
MDLVAAAASAAPRSSRPAPTRAERVTPEAFATARRRPGIEPLPAATALPLPTTDRSSAVSRRQSAPTTAPDLRSHPAKPAPAFDLALAQQPSAHSAPAPSRTAARPTAPAARKTSRRAATGSLPIPTLGGTPQPSLAPRGLASRRSAVEHAAAPAGSGRESAQLRGVPLASLASCATDREEDSLKQKLVAAVTTQKECVSPAGTYRFVETKNLNAFLMWIERAPSRTEANRCDELAHALACLK